jgi:hypothetical protein
MTFTVIVIVVVAPLAMVPKAHVRVPSAASLKSYPKAPWHPALRALEG